MLMVKSFKQIKKDYATIEIKVSDVLDTDVCFISVPTPSHKSGERDTRMCPHH